MVWLKTFLARVGALFHKRRLEEELEEELGLHLEMETGQNLRNGMNPAEARRAARLRLGNPELVKENCRDARGFTWVAAFLQDLRFAARMLRRSPGFTIVAVLSLGLVIGANATIFSVLNPILFYSLPYDDTNRLVVLSEIKIDQPTRQRAPTESTISEWSRNAQSFEQIERVAPVQNVTLSARDQAEPGFFNRVSPDFFSLLGIEPQLGRTFTPEELSHRPGEPVLLSDSYWRRRFGADAGVLGEQMLVGGQVSIIVGVLPPDFRFRITPYNTGEAHVWLSSNLAREPGAGRWLRPLARLKPGVSVEQARLELEAIGQHLEEANSPADQGWRTDVQLLPDALFAMWNKHFLLLSGIGLLVLLIGCANVANLLLARTRRREKEISVRISMGASRLRLVRQLLTESILLASLGGVLGLILTYWGIGIFVALAPQWWPFAQKQISIDGGVLAVTAAISLVTGVIFGLAPALRTSRPNLYESLKEGGRRSTGSDRQLLRNLLIASEVSLTFVLLVGTGLMVHSFMNVRQEDPGYDPTNLLSAHIFLQGSEYLAWPRTEERTLAPQVDQFWEELLERTEALPGVQSAAVSGVALLGCGFQIVGQAFTPPPRRPRVGYQAVSPSYFRTLGVPLVKGRSLTEHDTEGSRWVVVINEAGARQFFPGEDPLGKLVQLDFGGTGPSLGQTPVDEPQPREVVGVVGDMRRGLGVQTWPILYVPRLQHMKAFPSQAGTASATRKYLIVRTSSSPLSLKPALERVVAAIDPDQSPSYFRTHEQILSDSIQSPRFWMRLFSFFAAVAATLVVVGVFGVIASSVGERTHEMGVRMAIGAQKRDVFVLVIKQGLKMTLIGLVIGLAISLSLSRLLVSLRLPLYEISPTDPLTYVLAALLLLGISLVACYFPARRAMRVDPVVALKTE